MLAIPDRDHKIAKLVVSDAYASRPLLLFSRRFRPAEAAVERTDASQRPRLR